MHKIILSVILFLSLLNISCSQKPGQNKSDSSSIYNLNNPLILKLPESLNEISGIVYYPKDTSVFAIEDEDGIFSKIYIRNSPVIKNWHFDKKHDYEDVTLHDSTFYVLISNGDIETLKFSDDSIYKTKSKFPDADKHTNEFETLYWDDQYKQLVMICKNCEDDKKKAVTAWGFNPDSQTYTPSIFTINVKPIAKKIGEEKLHFKPSAAAINPLTNELYILASVNKLLAVADRNGNVKDVFKLDPKIFKQPEGITFTPKGDLLISNEAADAGNANILIFKYKK